MDDTSSTLKKCSKCKIEKEHSEFYADLRMKSKLRPDCKDCLKSLMKNHRAENAEKNRERSKLFRLNNPEKVKEGFRRYRKENPEKRALWERKRRANKYETRHIPYTKEDVLTKYGTKCHLCNIEINLQAARQPGKNGWENGLHIDHLISLVNGGTDTIENVRPSHGKCNLLKGARDV